MPDERFTISLEERPRSPFWYARIYLVGEGGRSRRWSTKIRVQRGAERRRSEVEAERVAERHAARLADQAGLAVAASTSTALEAVGERMLRAKEADGRRVRAVDALAFNLDKHVVPYFGKARDVGSIRRADLESFKQQLVSVGLAAQSVNNALTAVRQVLKYAWLVEELLEAVPMVANVRRDPTPKGRALTAEQVGQLLGAVDPREVEARHFLTFVANTGLRKSEALAVRFSWIDWQRKILHIPPPATKGARPRQPVALNDASLEVLGEREALHCERVDREDDRVFRELKHDEARNSAAIRAGLGRVRTHDLRHTLGSLHVAAGATLTEVRDTLGHSTMAMVSHYQHAYLDQRRQVADRVQIRPAESGTGCATGQRSDRGGKRHDPAQLPVRRMRPK